MRKAELEGGENIFISGVSRGLGLELARWYLEAGAHVYGCSRSEPPDALSERFGGRFHWRALDLTDSEHGPEELRNWLGNVVHWRLVVLNAGVLGTLADMREAELVEMRQTMEINLWANKWILDTLLEQARELRQVVAISSGASVSGSRGWNAYSLSKAALNMLIKLYAAEVPDTHWTAFAPGLVDTAMQETISSLPEDPRFPTLQRLKAARGTADMPDAREAAETIGPLLLALPNSHASGSFTDIRKMDSPGR